jgi:hypothetical protein
MLEGLGGYCILFCVLVCSEALIAMAFIRATAQAKMFHSHFYNERVLHFNVCYDKKSGQDLLWV